MPVHALLLSWNKIFMHGLHLHSLLIVNGKGCLLNTQAECLSMSAGPVWWTDTGNWFARLVMR